MGKATAWRQTIFISESGDWWMYSQNPARNQEPESTTYESSINENCTIQIQTNFIAQVLNTYIHGFKFRSIRSGIAIGIPYAQIPDRAQLWDKRVYQYGNWLHVAVYGGF